MTHFSLVIFLDDIPLINLKMINVWKSIIDLNIVVIIVVMKIVIIIIKFRIFQNNILIYVMITICTYICTYDIRNTLL